MPSSSIENEKLYEDLRDDVASKRKPELTSPLRNH